MCRAKLAAVIVASSLPGTASASSAPPGGNTEQDAAVSGSASVDTTGVDAGGESRARGSASGDGTHPLLRHTPRPGVVNFALYGGLSIPDREHNLLGSGATYKPLSNVMGSLGLRMGYFVLPWFGGEVEGGGYPGTLDGGGYVKIYHVRAHAIFQLPYRLTAFALFGPGVIMVDSPRSRLGTDPDPAADVGLGGRFFVNDWFDVRLGWRGTISGRAPSVHNEILLSVGFTVGPKRPEPPKPPPPPVDSDGDGFLDAIDKCVHERGVAPDGCPDPDRDKDGIPNQSDKCPDEYGPGPDGCPPKDKDKDGILDDEDLCPEEPGIEPDGCPIADRDKDQILDPDDKCPDEPETRNGFEDTDGCPDELPKEVEQFTGVIKGIYFDLDKATIQRRSNRVLSEAVKVLDKYPEIKVEIVGHTDSTGNDAYNLELSQKRAEAVRQFLIDKGIDGDRLVARGAGEGEPISDNKTPIGRAENRRTEFNIID
jgi:OOP family OmpA-OmpF porin